MILTGSEQLLSEAIKRNNHGNDECNEVVFG